MGKITSPIFLILLILALPLAYAVNPVGLPQFSYDGTKGTASLIVTLESTKLKETGLLELQMFQGFPSQAIFGNPTTCDPSKPYQKAVPYAFDQIGEKLTITINNEGIPDGTYSPMLVHVDRCCSSGSCNAIQPYGWGYPLTSDKIIFKRQASSAVCAQDVQQCPDGSFVGRDENCNFKPCQIQQTDFELSNLKIITAADIFANTGIPLGVRFLKATKGSLGDVYALTIKNTGSLNSGAQLETYYVSAANPFYSSISSFFSPAKLQSFAGQEGITQNPQTCKNEVGASYTLDPLSPRETKTLYLFVPYPSKGDKLAGNDNYNADGKYLLVVDAYDNCQNANIYSIIGGTLNFQVDTSGNIKKDGSEVSSASIPQTHTYQKTISKDFIQKTTATDLLKSACSSSDVCEPTSTCQSIQSLIDDGVLSETKAKSDISVQQRIIADTAGATIGSVGAALIGTKAGLGLCAAFAAGTGGLGLPICLGVLASGGAILGGTIGDSFFKIFKNIDEAKLNEAGYCVPKAEEGFTFKGLTETIGKSVNEFFNTKGKIKDFTLGIIIIGFVIFVVTKKT